MTGRAQAGNSILWSTEQNPVDEIREVEAHQDTDEITSLDEKAGH